MRRRHVGLFVGSLAIAAAVLLFAARQSAETARNAAEASTESDAATSIMVAAANEAPPRPGGPAQREYAPVKARGLELGGGRVRSAKAGHAPEPVAPDATEVLGRLRRQGLPIGDYVSYTAETDENDLLGRPGQYVSKVNFRDTRISAEETLGDPTSIDGGGSIETFANETDAEHRLHYVEAITQSVAVFAEYDYLVGTVLLRVSKVLTPSQAAAYKQALRRVTT